METPDLHKLVELLRQNNKSDQYIIETLVDIIKQYMQYGGSLNDIVYYQYRKADIN
jgi:hypothetical protein